MSPENSRSAIAPTEEIIAEIRAGRMVILVDEEDRENEGDLMLAAEHVTPEAINFMVTHARGLVCLTITDARARQLGLAQMARENRSPYSTAFTTTALRLATQRRVCSTNRRVDRERAVLSFTPMPMFR